tara:strand:+ start:2478 stop:2621 length:144 start_codon:yes stop_codon:yes gene_type:complete
MRFYQARQSLTSPVKYSLELSEEELEIVKKQMAEILHILYKVRKEDE